MRARRKCNVDQENIGGGGVQWKVEKKIIRQKHYDIQFPAINHRPPTFKVGFILRKHNIFQEYCQSYEQVICFWGVLDLYKEVLQASLAKWAAKGASINDVRIFGIFFYPLPPPCPNSIY